MKSITQIALVFAAFSSALAAFPASADPAAQTLLCRGGGDMRLTVSPTEDGTFIELRFRKAVKSETKEPSTLKAGECRWPGRPLNAREPALLGLELPVQIWTEIPADGDGIARAQVTGQPGNQRAQDTARRFLHAVRGDGLFSLDVHNTNAGWFRVMNLNADS